jgi:hypothetical protein
MRSSWLVGLAMLTASCVSAPPPVMQAPPPYPQMLVVAWSGGGGPVEGEPACERPLDQSSVTGLYTGTWGKVYLEQQGDRVVGSYPCCGGGTIEGTLVGDVLEFQWTEPGRAGLGVFRRIAPDRFAGSWGSQNSHSSGGAWNLVRVR